MMLSLVLRVKTVLLEMSSRSLNVYGVGREYEIWYFITEVKT
jgi:hypothetical protein